MQFWTPWSNVHPSSVHDVMNGEILLTGSDELSLESQCHGWHVCCKWRTESMWNAACPNVGQRVCCTIFIDVWAPKQRITGLIKVKHGVLVVSLKFSRSIAINKGDQLGNLWIRLKSNTSDELLLRRPIRSIPSAIVATKTFVYSKNTYQVINNM